MGRCPIHRRPRVTRSCDGGVARLLIGLNKYPVLGMPCPGGHLTIELMRVSHRRRCRWLAFTGLTVGAAAVLFGLTPDHQRSALAATTSLLVPIAQGAEANWTQNSGPTEVGAVGEGACRAFDTSYVTGSYLLDSTYKVDTSAIPEGAALTSVDVTICYADNDSTRPPAVGNTDDRSWVHDERLYARHVRDGH